MIRAALAKEQPKGVLIAGEAGVGKTRLALEAVAAAAADGWAVKRIAGTDSGQAVPLGAFARWAAQVDPARPAAVGDIMAKLASGTGDAPLLVFVDDGHLLDNASAMLVHQLVVQDIATVIVTVRNGERAPATINSLWKDDLLRRLELQALSRADSRQLLESVLGAPLSGECAGQLWTMTRGNVLFLRHLVDQERSTGRLECGSGRWRWRPGPLVSPSLIEVVEMQIGAVPTEIRDVVDLVAVAEPVDRACLADVVDVQLLEDAEERGLIQVSSITDMVHVGHPLYGELRRSKCRPLRLRRLRGQIAEAMARADKPERVDPLRLGLLWLDSDLPPDPTILSQAAMVARSRLDLEVAERLARAAVDADAGAPIKLLLAYILFMREKGPEAEEVLDDIGDDELPGAGFVNPAILRAANRLWVLRRPEESRDLIEDRLRVCEPGAADSLLTFRAVQLVLAGWPAETVDTMAGVDHTKLDTFGRTLGLCAETIALGDLGRPKHAAEKAAAGYAAVSASPMDTYQGTALAEFHAYALLAAGYIDEAVAVAEQRHQLCADMPGMISSMATAVLGMTALGKGDLQTARNCLQSAAADLGAYGDVSGIFYRFGIVQTEALARSGKVDAAMAALAATQRIRHPAYTFVESGYLLSIAWVAAARGRLSEALGFARSAVEFARTHGQLAREVMCLQAVAQFGDGDVAARLGELAALVDGPRAALCQRYARAVSDSDGAALEAVSFDFEAMGDVLAAADAAAQAATSHRQAGRRGSALTVAGRAQRLAGTCGGAVSPPLAAAKLGFPFTRREHEIAVLVAQGLSNREIAEATSLSVRTVEGHILRATIKAGVARRAELVTVLTQLDPLAAPASH